jgi:hypothetical protein
MSAAVSGLFKRPYLVEVAIYEGDELVTTAEKKYYAFGEMDAKRKAEKELPNAVEVISILRITEF